MTQVVFVRVHEPEAVREIITEALAIAAEYEGDAAARQPIFEQACELLGARTMLQPTPAANGFPLDLSQLRG